MSPQLVTKVFAKVQQHSKRKTEHPIDKHLVFLVLKSLNTSQAKVDRKFP